MTAQSDDGTMDVMRPEAETWPKHAEIYVEGQGHVVYWPHYYSTYCIHERHENCRLTCKHCGEECMCSCHQPAEQFDGQEAPK